MLPILTFLAGLTIASHKLLASSRNKNTSTCASDLSFLAYNLAGYTFVLFNTKTSPFLKYDTISLNFLCSIDISFRLSTINLEFSRALVGLSAIKLSGTSKSNDDKRGGFSTLPKNILSPY